MNQSPLQAAVLFHVGFVPVSRTVVTTWGLIAGLTAGCWIATRGFKVVAGGGWQAVIETDVRCLALRAESEPAIWDAGPAGWRACRLEISSSVVP